MWFPTKITSSFIWVAIRVERVILHWMRTDGRSVFRCTVTWLPNFLGWIDFLSYGAPHIQIVVFNGFLSDFVDITSYVYVVVNFLFQLIFIFLLFLGMVMYGCYKPVVLGAKNWHKSVISCSESYWLQVQRIQKSSRKKRTMRTNRKRNQVRSIKFWS